MNFNSLRLDVNLMSRNFGLARSLMATALILTLVFNSYETLFEISGTNLQNQKTHVDYLNFFGLVGLIDQNLSRFLAILILCFVVAGWKPKYTAFFHFWIAQSFARSAFMFDGGDVIHANLSLLILPICLLDKRNNHWVDLDIELSLPRRMVISTFWIMIRIQMAFLYLHASVGKFLVREWLDGTAVYYWLTNPYIGLGWPATHFWQEIFSNEYIIFSLNWGALILELFLFAGLISTRSIQKVLFVLGLFFHAMIVFFFGLPSFALVMSGALLLYLGPVNRKRPI